MKNKFLLLCSLSLFLFISCTKENSLIPTDNSNSQIVAAVSIDLANELDIKTGTEISFPELASKKTGKSSNNSCATIKMDPESNTFPKTFYVDFGTGCTVENITRKGTLKITFTNYITESGSTMTIERDNYYVNGNKVEGKVEYKNTTVNQDTPQWTRTITDGKFTNSDGNIYLNNGTLTVKQTEGASTTTLDDDTYEMTDGTHTVSKQNGAKITLTVLETLVKKYNCNYVSKGKLKVESTLMNGVIDYGNGDCDNSATYTQNGIVFPFSM